MGTVVLNGGPGGGNARNLMTLVVAIPPLLLSSNLHPILMNGQSSQKSRPVENIFHPQDRLVSSNVTFLLGEQLETLVYASVKMADRVARESRWGVRIWAGMRRAREGVPRI